MAKKTPVTRAIHALREADVGYTEHPFDYRRFKGAEPAAEALGVDPHATAKTIVFTTHESEGVVVVMHGDVEVSTKKLARLLDTKTLRPATQQEADRVTGYQFGGTSPLGMRSDPPIYLQESLLGLETIYVNAGSRGFLIGIDPGMLAELCKARVADVST